MFVKDVAEKIMILSKMKDSRNNVERILCYSMSCKKQMQTKAGEKNGKHKKEYS